MGLKTTHCAQKIRRNALITALILGIGLLSPAFAQQNSLLFSVEGWTNNNSSQISETTNFGMLTEQHKLNSYGIMAGTGMRLSNNIGIEVFGGYLAQKWNYTDATLTNLTNGIETNYFRNKMNLANFHVGLHKVFKKNGANFIYFKTGLDVNFIKTGDYWNDDPSGIGPQRIYNVTYRSAFAMYASPEFGLFLSATEKSELSIWTSYKIGLNSMFDFNYQLDGLGDYANYNIDGTGNQLSIGLKYTILKPLLTDKKPKEKKEKPVKEPKEKKEKEPKPEKEKKEKELKVDKDGIPKTLKDRDVVKNKTIYVKSTNITFRVWDSGKEVDGDTISLNLNGEWILESFGLSREKKGVSVTISEDGKNFLMLYAINMGKFPPNTAAVSVWDGEREQILELKSDLKSCGALNIVYRPK